MIIGYSKTVRHGIETIRCARETSSEQEAGDNSKDETLDGIHNEAHFPVLHRPYDCSDYRISGSNL